MKGKHPPSGHRFARWIVVLTMLVCMASTATAKAEDWLMQASGKYFEGDHLAALPLALKAAESAHADPKASALQKEDAASFAARVLEELQRFPEAELWRKRALVWDEQRHGLDSPRLQAALMNLAGNLMAQNRLEDAKPHYDRLLGLLQRAHGAASVELAMVRNALATWHRRQGQLPEAEALLRQVLLAWTTARGSAHPSTAIAQRNLAILLTQREAGWMEAERWYAAALRIQRSLWRDGRAPRDAHQLASSLDAFAALRDKQGKRAQADRLRAESAALRAGYDAAQISRSWPSWGQDQSL